MSKLGANIFFDSNYFELHTYGPQQFVKIGVVKVDYLDFPGEIFEKLV